MSDYGKLISSFHLNLLKYIIKYLACVALISIASAIAASVPSQAEEVVGATAGKIDVGSSGEATYTIPISVPKGTVGMQPKIALRYNSMTGNNVMGVGWSIATTDDDWKQNDMSQSQDAFAAL